MKRITKFSIAAVFVTALGAVVLVLSPAIHPKPRVLQTCIQTSEEEPLIAWSLEKLTATVSPGGTLQMMVTASVSCIPATTVSVAPALAPYVSVTPQSLPAQGDDAHQTFTLTFAPAAAVPFGTIEGTLELRVGQLALEKSLPIALNVWPSLQTPGQVSFNYPPTLYVLPDPAGPSGHLIQSSPREIVLGGAAPEDPTIPYDTDGYVISVRSATYTPPFDITQWLSGNDPASIVDTLSTVAVSGVQAYQVTFRDEVGAGQPITIIPLANTVVEISYGSSFDSGSPEEVDALNTYDEIVQSMHLTP